jgi:dCMP deaminase
MKDPDRLWKDLCYRFAEQSRCKSRKVGAVIVKKDTLLAEGWNSAPSGAKTDDCPRAKCQGAPEPTGSSLDQAICCHAEANAIASCAKRGIYIRGAQIYCTSMPCLECQKLIIGAGIVEVIYDVDYPSPLNLFEAANIKVRQFNVAE